MLQGQMLPGQKSPWQLKSVQDGPRNLPFLGKYLRLYQKTFFNDPRSLSEIILTTHDNNNHNGGELGQNQIEKTV